MIDNKYGAMFGQIPQAVNPSGKESLGGMRALMLVAAAYGRGGAPGISKSVLGEVPFPPYLDACFAIIDDNDGNRHAWTEVSLADPENIKRMVGGRRGTIDIDSSSEGSSSSDTDGIDDQTAWGLSGESYSPGTIVYVIRINYNAWGIVGGCCDGSSSSDDGSFCFEVDCDAGTINVIDCDSTGGTSSNPSSSNPSSSNPSSSNPNPSSSSNVIIDDFGMPGGGRTVTTGQDTPITDF